jgi:hypothetical protein
MCKPMHKVLRKLGSALVLLVLLGLAYTYQRSKFVQKTNVLFDSHGNAFHGFFLPWPLGGPTLAGSFDPTTDRRVRAALGYGSGSVTTNGLTLIIHASDGSIFGPREHILNIRHAEAVSAMETFLHEHFTTMA